MEKEKKQMNKNIKRIIIGSALVCVSLVVGLVTGIQISSGETTIIDDNSPTDQLSF